MKTEEFDDAIRRKAESVYFNPKEADIDRIHKHVSGNIVAPSLFKAYALYAVIGVSLMAIGGLATWGVMQHNENTRLAEKVELLNREITKSSTSSNTAPDTRLSDNNKSSSVTEKNTGNASNNSNKILPNGNAIAANSNGTINKPSNIQGISSGNKNTSSSKTAYNTTFRSTPATRTNPISKQPVLNNHENNATEQQTLDNNSTEKNNLVTSKQDKPTINNGNTFSGNGENKISNENITDASNTAKAKKTDSASTLTKNTEKQDNPLPSEPKLYNRPAKNKQSSLALSLKNLHYMAGIGTEFANKQAGFGIYGQVAFTDRWSLSVGLKSQMVNNEDYDDDGDFHNKKGVDFRHIYGLKDPDSPNISNIRMHDVILQIPIAINYTLPIGNNYGIVFSAGTDIDLYARQSVEYLQFQPNLGYSPPPKHVDVAVPALAFNNSVLAVGLQKRWGHLVAQVSPYVCPQFAQVVYKKEDLYAGARFRLMYAFGN